MKKRLKGLVALVMAMAMVVSVAPSSLGAISNEKYEECGDYYNYMYAYSSVRETPDEIEFDPYYTKRVSVGEEAKSAYSDWVLDNYHTDFYDTVAWEIWGRTQDGGYDSEKIKEVDYGYVVTAEDIKEYGCIATDDSGNDIYYPPVLRTVYDSADFGIDLYNTEGSIEKTIIVNMHSVDKDLDIPEGYVGYILHSQYSEKEEPNPYKEARNPVAFVADYEDIWTEIEMMTCYGYEPVKLVPTMKMPFYFGQFYTFSDENQYEEYTIYLSPGEDLMSNEVIKEELKEYTLEDGSEIDEENANWSYWRVNYCGSTTYLNNAAEFENGKAPTVEQYTDSRKGIYTGGYADDYYYTANFPGIWINNIISKTYRVPVYDFDGSVYNDEYISKNSLGYDDGSEWQPYEIYIWSYDERFNDCIWHFEYDGVKYGQIKYYKDIWDIAIADGNYDPSKAKLIAICTEHDFDYDNGKVVANPTATTKGKTEYGCKNCTFTKTVEDIPCLNSIESVKLSNTAYTYTGSFITPAVTVKGYVNGTLKTLQKNVDYTVTYSNNKVVGTGKVTITGKGDFAGTKTVTFKINPAKITETKTQIDPVYTGKAIKAKSLIVKSAGKTLKEGTDYTVSYSNNTKIGTAKITVKGKGNYTGTITAKFTIKPGKVTGLKQSGYYTNKIKLRWNATKGATGYIVYRVNTKTGELKYIGSTKSTAFESKSLKSGTDYKYAVKAYTNVNGTKIYGSRSVIKTMMTETAATSIRATSTVKKKVTVTWNKVTGADGYEVFRATSKNGTYKKIATTNKNKTMYTNSSYTSKKTYYFKVRSYKYNAGGAKVYSAYSTIKSIKIK